MQRIVFLLVTFGAIALVWFAMSHYQNAYKILPAPLPSEVSFPKFGGWQSFTPPTKAFSVMLPVLPQHATETQKERKYEMYISQTDNGTIYMVSLIRFKKPLDDKFNELLLNTIMEDLLHSNPENKLISHKMDTFQGQRAMFFTINNKEITMRGITFVYEHVLFVLSYISKVNNKDDYDHFVNSFHINKEHIQE